MPGIEDEEKEICVGSLQFHHRHLPPNLACSQVFIRNLETGTVKRHEIHETDLRAEVKET